MDEWYSPELLSNRKWLSGIKSAVYVMQSRSDATLFRSGVVGGSLQNNNAWKRLFQLNSGMPDKGPWMYAFLAPFPNDIGSVLTDAEDIMQNALRATFDCDKRDLFHTLDIQRVRQIASSTIHSFLETRHTGDRHALHVALRDYVAVVSPAIVETPG